MPPQLSLEEGRARVDRLRNQTMRALSGEPTDDPIFAGLQRVVADCEIPHRYPMDHLDGFVMDVEGREYRTLDRHGGVLLPRRRAWSGS